MEIGNIISGTLGEGERITRHSVHIQLLYSVILQNSAELLPVSVSFKNMVIQTLSK